MLISDWSSDVCSSDLACTFWPRPNGNSTTIWSTESTGSDSGRMCATPLPAMSGHLLVGGTGGGDQDLGPCRDEREVAGRKVLLARTVPVLEKLGRHLTAQVHREPATRRETATRRRVDRKSTRVNSSHSCAARMPSSA